MTPNSILIYIGPGDDYAIGENFMKMPFLRAIRNAFPDAVISWIHGSKPSQFNGILKPLNQGLIDEILSDADLGSGLSAMMPWHRELPGRHFDLIIDTQKMPQRTLVLKRIDHDVLISPTWRYLFSDKTPPAQLKKSSALTDKLMALAAAATGNTEKPNHIIPISEPLHRGAQRLLPDGPCYVGFAPGAGITNTGKCWPLERFIALAKQQQDRGRTSVFLTGPQEQEQVPAIRKALPQALFPLAEIDTLSDILDEDMCGPVLTMALAGQLSVSVANCSGTGHMLAAGGSPLVSLFGPTSPKKFAPYTPDLTIIRAQDFGGEDIECIPLEAVENAVEKTLSLQ